MRKLTLVSATVLAAAFTASIAVAQTQATPPTRPNRMGPPAAGSARQPGGQQPDARQPGAQRGRQLGGGPAANLLRMSAQLELTDDQVKRLEALRSTPQARVNQADMMRAQADLLDATKGDVNLDKARAAFDRMARLKTDQQVAGLKARQDARNVLTAAQKTKVDNFTSAMRSRRSQAIRGRSGIRGGGRNGIRGGGRNGIRGGGRNGIDNGPNRGFDGRRGGQGQGAPGQPGFQRQPRPDGQGIPPMAPNRVRPPEDSIPR